MNPFTSGRAKSEAKRGSNPGIRNIALGALLLFAGPFALFVWLVISILSSGDSENRFLVPGEFEMLVEKPGDLTLWNSHAVLYDGKNYNADPGLPNGTEIVVLAEDGSQLEFIPNTGVSVSSGSEAKKSVGYVKVENPGFIRFLVSGAFEERVFSISQGRPGAIFRRLLISIPIGAASVVAGIVFLVLGLVAYSNARNADKERERISR